MKPDETIETMPDSYAELLTETRLNVARLEVEVQHLTAGLTELVEVTKLQSANIDQMRQLMSEARGGWRTLMLVGGMASSAGAGITWMIEHLTK